MLFDERNDFLAGRRRDRADDMAAAGGAPPGSGTTPGGSPGAAGSGLGAGPAAARPRPGARSGRRCSCWPRGRPRPASAWVRFRRDRMTASSTAISTIRTAAPITTSRTSEPASDPVLVRAAAPGATVPSVAARAGVAPEIAITAASPEAIGTQVPRSVLCDTWSDVSSEAGQAGIAGQGWPPVVISDPALSNRATCPPCAECVMGELLPQRR